MISPKRPSVAQRLDELLRLVRLAVPLLEVGFLALEEAVDRLDDHAQHLAIALADLRVREQVFLEDRPPSSSCLAALWSRSRRSGAVAGSVGAIAFIVVTWAGCGGRTRPGRPAGRRPQANFTPFLMRRSKPGTEGRHTPSARGLIGPFRLQATAGLPACRALLTQQNFRHGAPCANAQDEEISSEKKGPAEESQHTEGHAGA